MATDTFGLNIALTLFTSHQKVLVSIMNKLYYLSSWPISLLLIALVSHILESKVLSTFFQSLILHMQPMYSKFLLSKYISMYEKGLNPVVLQKFIFGKYLALNTLCSINSSFWTILQSCLASEAKLKVFRS